VVYCNPNAGLWELQSPLPPGLPPLSSTLDPPPRGDDQGAGQPEGWVEFYLGLGYDVALFNYRGYGSSVFRKVRIRGLVVFWGGGGNKRGIT
jgi:hypothetical protein